MSPQVTPDDTAPAAATLRRPHPLTPAPRLYIGLVLGAAALVGAGGGRLLDGRHVGRALLGAHAVGEREEFDDAVVWVARRAAVRSDLADVSGGAPSGAPPLP